MVSTFSADEAASASELTARDLVLCDSLTRIGTPPNVARILLCLSKGGWMDSTILQDSCRLRQPEVSIAMRSLIELEIVQITQQKTGGRGRPRHTYRLVGGLADAIHPFILDARNELNTLEGSLTRIEEATAKLRTSA